MNEREPGRLYYLIGPSGAGKDSILAGARARLDGHRSVTFVRRYITRPSEVGGEDHIALSVTEFDARRAGGDFLLCWESHGLCYGIGREVERWLAEGRQVAVNGSRAYLETARRRVPSLVPVVIRVSRECLRERLLGRGREDAASIEARLERAERLERPVPGAVVIDNDGPLAAAVEAFCRLLVDHPPTINRASTRPS